jgi:hypothetical protein
MYDASKIVAGLAVFAVLATSPLWYNRISAASAEEPELKLPPNGASRPRSSCAPTTWLC